MARRYVTVKVRDVELQIDIDMVNSTAPEIAHITFQKPGGEKPCTDTMFQKRVPQELYVEADNTAHICITLFDPPKGIDHE